VAFKRGLAATALLLQYGCSGVANSGLESALAANNSATAVLQSRCPVPIAATPVKGTDSPRPAGLAALLGKDTGYRHVRLSCGNSVLSEAHNWYARDRLTPEMNHTLDTADTPFGKVAAPLAFTRERLESRRGASPECPRSTILSHRALLRLPDGKPLALVVECYTRANLLN